MTQITDVPPARAEYDVAMEIRLAQKILNTAATRSTAVQGELNLAKHALEDAAERAPLAIEQAPIVSNNLRVMARATIEAYWRDVLPKLEEAVTAAERCCQDNTQAVSDAEERLDQLLAAAYARVQPASSGDADRRGQL